MLFLYYYLNRLFAKPFQHPPTLSIRPTVRPENCWNLQCSKSGKWMLKVNLVNLVITNRSGPNDLFTSNRVPHYKQFDSPLALCQNGQYWLLIYYFMLRSISIRKSEIMVMVVMNDWWIDLKKETVANWWIGVFIQSWENI